jgi:hypothetical protein
MQTSSNFVAHCLDLLKGRGTSGHVGTAPAKPLNTDGNLGTSRLRYAVPADLPRSRCVSTGGTTKAEVNQVVAASGTAVTSGTACSRSQPSEGQHAPPLRLSASTALPNDWRDGFLRLSGAERLANFTVTRWSDLVQDAAAFLNVWGEQAARLGWTATDIFGVHPRAPSTRYDQMGVALLIHGGAVVAITDSTAVIKELSGSALTWRRSVDRRSVPIWELIERSKQGK